MFCTASAGPGTSNLLTSAALAHANRLPMLMLCGDTYVTRLPDPVLQQLEHFGDPTLGVNDAFRSVVRYWDRITHPAQIIQSLPNAVATMLDPADCGPAFLGLPQDIQGWVYDYPTVWFEKKVHRIRRQTPDETEIADAAALLASAERPMIIAGGGVQYSRAVEELTNFAETHQIPVVETIAGRANMIATHPLNIGPIGVTGSNSANAIAEQADVIVAVGTRLQDFTTGSWTAFAKDARFISINAGRHDAGKHMSLPVVGDAKLSLTPWPRKPQAMQRPIIGSPKRKGIGQTGMLMLQTTWHQEIDRIPMRWQSASSMSCATDGTVWSPQRGACPLKLPPTGARWNGERWMLNSDSPVWAMKFPGHGAPASPSPNANRIRIRSYLSATALT